MAKDGIGDVSKKLKCPSPMAVTGTEISVYQKYVIIGQNLCGRILKQHNNNSGKIDCAVGEHNESYL